MRFKLLKLGWLTEMKEYDQLVHHKKKLARTLQLTSRKSSGDNSTKAHSEKEAKQKPIVESEQFKYLEYAKLKARLREIR
jgi:hypothetical protein